MKFHRFFSTRWHREVSRGHLGLVLASAWALSAQGQPSSRTVSDDWTVVRIMATPLAIPPSASGNQKSEAENKSDQQQQAAAYVAAAAKAKDFYTKNPTHENANDAKKIEALTLLRAAQHGMVEQEPAALRLADAVRKDKTQSSANRFEVATQVTQIDMGKKNFKNVTDLMSEHEQQALNLLGEFPDEPGVYDYFLGVARNSDPVRAKAMAQRVLLMPAPAAHKAQAKAIMDRLALPGSSPTLEWQDENGVARQVKDLKGKIVVFYVWGTWASDIDASNRTVAAAIKGGIELVSVNVDTDVQKGQQAAKKASLPTSDNYYDARSLQGPLPLQLKVEKVPSVHVINAKGVYIGSGSPAGLAALLVQAAK